MEPPSILLMPFTVKLVFKILESANFGFSRSIWNSDGFFFFRIAVTHIRASSLISSSSFSTAYSSFISPFSPPNVNKSLILSVSSLSPSVGLKATFFGSDGYSSISSSLVAPVVPASRGFYSESIFRFRPGFLTIGGF